MDIHEWSKNSMFDNHSVPVEVKAQSTAHATTFNIVPHDSLSNGPYPPSLKSQTSIMASLLDLPNEILADIYAILMLPGDDPTDTMASLSGTCRRLHLFTVPYIKELTADAGQYTQISTFATEPLSLRPLLRRLMNRRSRRYAIKSASIGAIENKAVRSVRLEELFRPQPGDRCLLAHVLSEARSELELVDQATLFEELEHPSTGYSHLAFFLMLAPRLETLEISQNYRPSTRLSQSMAMWTLNNIFCGSGTLFHHLKGLRTVICRGCESSNDDDDFFPHRGFMSVAILLQFLRAPFLTTLEASCVTSTGLDTNWWKGLDPSICTPATASVKSIEITAANIDQQSLENLLRIPKELRCLRLVKVTTPMLHLALAPLKSTLEELEISALDLDDDLTSSPGSLRDFVALRSLRIGGSFNMKLHGEGIDITQLLPPQLVELHLEEALWAKVDCDGLRELVAQLADGVPGLVKFTLRYCYVMETVEERVVDEREEVQELLEEIAAVADDNEIEFEHECIN
ncbi:MAG: hypothetical protein M1833_006010 [Piccolia ochrophora]|nr:MAG: hypothetical protein M1833_006010 [Piccolia ochrophora]